mgnify:CR=1 FL=1
MAREVIHPTGTNVYAVGPARLSMVELQHAERRETEEEEPLDAQQIFNGPKWLRRILLRGSRNGD